MQTIADPPALPSARRWRAGWLNGLAGMAIFSVSLPATRVAVLQLNPLFLTFARAAIAGVLGLGLLLVRRERRPAARDFGALLVVAAGVVVGFPLLTALALRHITSPCIDLLGPAAARDGTVRRPQSS